MNKIRLGLALTGSYCSFGKLEAVLPELCAAFDVTPIFSENALRDFAASYDCDQLSRIVDSIIRSLKFGSTLSDILGEAAQQSRETYRAALAERVAKAPVKMMLPTGTLILPAMLLLVLGPILLELAGGF